MRHLQLSHQSQAGFHLHERLELREGRPCMQDPQVLSLTHIWLSLQFVHNQNAAQDGQDRVKAIQRHLVWQLAAFVCLVGGFYAIYRNKVNPVHITCKDYDSDLTCHAPGRCS